MPYRINQFSVESNLELPVNSDASIVCDALRETSTSLSIRHQKGALNEFSQVRWAGRIGDGFLRIYDVGDGVVVCALDDLRMHVNRAGDTVILDFELSDREALAGALALSTNSGISISTLFGGDIALHGAGVEIDGRFIGIMAPSGAGKSTTLWSLLDNGALFGNDDVIPVRCIDGRVVAFPSITLHAKLSRDALEKRGWDAAQYEEWVPNSDEYWIPIEAKQRVQEPRPLAALFVLRPTVNPAFPNRVHISQVTGGTALSLLMENTQGLMAAAQLLNGKELFARYAEIIHTVPLYALHYHKSYDALPALTQLIRDLISLENCPHTSFPNRPF